ncbi:hypothetical protein KJA13_04125 [Patescibacteria group bacterium]|nr:hypothetical protein [Patescibacteria group bacterium]
MKVFVAMPFDDKVSKSLYDHSIKPVCKKLGLSAIRADEIFSTNPILEDIIGTIESAKVIIADITGRNANVFYELGMSHILKRSHTVMITRDAHRDVPFDVGHFRIIKYNNSIAGKTRFENNLEQTLKTILADPRVHKADEFTQVEKIFRLLERRSELNNIVARRALGFSPDIESIWGHEVFDLNGFLSAAVSIYGISSFRGCHGLGYVEFTDKTINFTPTGEAFADFLIEMGYRCAYVNGKILIKGHKPSELTKKEEYRTKRTI